MAPIPKSTLIGIEPLHARAMTALQTCQETQSIDFKRSEAWDSLKSRLIETVLGMGNLRDGGIIIIGVAEQSNSWELTGIFSEHLATFDVDLVIDQTNAYVSPHVSLSLAVVDYGGKAFLAIEAKEFRETPLVCKKNGPQGSKLVEGALYVRPPGMPRTTRVMTAEQMHDLLELAAEKRARRILEVGRRVGLVPGATAVQKFDDELGEL